eukprot:247244-Pyramimonas_sp.AAC.1
MSCCTLPPPPLPHGRQPRPSRPQPQSLCIYPKGGGPQGCHRLRPSSRCPQTSGPQEFGQQAPR